MISTRKLAAKIVEFRLPGRSMRTMRSRIREPRTPMLALISSDFMPYLQDNEPDLLNEWPIGRLVVE